MMIIGQQGKLRITDCRMVNVARGTVPGSNNAKIRARSVTSLVRVKIYAEKETESSIDQIFHNM